MDDLAKKVSQADIEKLKQAVQLLASSYGLQLCKVLIINDLALREEVKPVSWNQNQIKDASHLFVFVIRTKLIRMRLMLLYA